MQEPDSLADQALQELADGKYDQDWVEQVLDQLSEENELPWNDAQPE
jgi:hypothetical protein